MLLLKYQTENYNSTATLSIESTSSEQEFLEAGDPEAPFSYQPQPSISEESNSSEHFSPLSSLSVEGLDRTLEHLEQGNIVFDAPQSMEIDKPEIIELLLSPTKSIEELQRELESEKEIESATIEITNNMEAKLSGEGFATEPLRPEHQAVSGRRTTRWEWKVTPTRSGKQKLELTLSIYIIPNNQKIPYVLKTFKKNIEVKISPKTHMYNFLKSVWDFIFDNWEWAWTIIVAPVSLWIWRQRNQRIPTFRTPDQETPNRRTPT